MSYKIKYIFLAIAIVSGLLAAYLIKGVYSKYGKINKTIIVSGKDSLLINSINFNMEVKGAGHGHNDFKTGIETFTFDTKQDTVYINSDTESKHRYFLVSYTFARKNFDGINAGSMWFESDGFPSKNQIDSIVYDGLPLNKECYQHIIINSIYEFKNEDDYKSFNISYKGSLKQIKNKKSCK